MSTFVNILALVPLALAASPMMTMSDQVRSSHLFLLRDHPIYTFYIAHDLQGARLCHARRCNGDASHG